MNEPSRGNEKISKTTRLHRIALTAVVLFLIVAGGLLLRVIAKERRARQQLESTAAAGPTLLVHQVALTQGPREITLPGDVRAYQQATLYAKISGYLKQVTVERGDRVKLGQVLGVLEAPDYEQQVSSARSDAEQKARVAERARRLVAEGIISQQEKETADTDNKVAATNVTRLYALQGYDTIRAPFEGIITARYADPGALLPAATGATQSALPLVDLANTDRVRVFVYAAQDIAPFLQPGLPVTLWQDETPDRRREASITRTSQSLDQRARTLLCEIVVDNQEWGVLPGTFVRVRFQIPASSTPTIPADALVFRNSKPLVGVVENQRIRFVPVEVGFHQGSLLRVTKGLTGGEQIGINIPVELEEGATVRPVEAKRKP